ncbi:MAG: succinate dehydrogenase, hydrophobic membrane anchor protein [Gammaproteobacteria bacterium]|jgi:succinate dehydrogenase / fumarate reductase membrane anchor subunit|nr:succinate dehydrogenase, hydrophobic membrane anchor protein [Gammaproteobacteria bacterium]
MVTNVLSLGRSGLYDWVIQRLSAVIILLYVLCHAAIVIGTPEMTYSEWRGLFANTTMRIFSLVTLLALCAHAWVGIWTIATDYLTTRMLGAKATAIRFIFLMTSLCVTVIYLIWGIMIFWSV